MRLWLITLSLMLVACAREVQADAFMDRIRITSNVVGCSSFKPLDVVVDDRLLILEGAWKNYWGKKPKIGCKCSAEQAYFKSFFVTGEDSDLDRDPEFLSSGLVTMSFGGEEPGRMVLSYDAERVLADDRLIEVRLSCADKASQR